MEVPHYFRLGSPASPNGALYCIKDTEGSIQVYTEIIKSALQANGILVTPDIEQEIISYFRQQEEEYDRQINSEGIPEKLKTLLSFTKKSKLVVYCKRIQISEDELFLLIHNCSQIGFKHQSRFTQFVPPSRKLLDSDIADMKQGNTSKFTSKIHRIFEERKNYMVHLFERSKEWHCFYYTYKDMDDKSHWRLGPHLHYVSYLWPNYRKRQVWESFDKRTINIQGVHIKLEPSVIDSQSFNRQFKSLAIDMLNKFKASQSQ